MTIDEQKVYETSDIYLAAYLRNAGLHYVSLRHSTNRVFFAFQDSPDRRELVRAFYSDEATLSPRILRDGVRDLKSLIRSARPPVEPI
jgi:hypothetical protein